jgi:hypothetical protein
MKRRIRTAIAFLVVVAAMLAAFVVVDAQPAVAEYLLECHTPYVYSNVTVYAVHTDLIDCHTVFGHTDYLVDHDQHLPGFSCGTTHDHSKVSVHCTNLEHRDRRFVSKWITHPLTICPAAASTPASSIFTRTRAEE